MKISKHNLLNFLKLNFIDNQGFNFNKLFQDSKKVQLTPKEYFSTMETKGGLGEPIIKVLIYGVIAGIFALLWSLFHLSGGMSLFGGAVGFLGITLNSCGEK